MRVVPVTGQEQSEASKLALLLVLCAAWLIPGLIGHDPWKSDDATSFGIVFHMLRSGDWLVPTLAGETALQHAPLYYWVAATSAKLFSPVLALYDGARLASGVFVSLALLATGSAARELFGKGVGRPAVLIFIGCVGLLTNGHEMLPENALLAGYALALYGFALAERRGWMAGVILGQGVGISFLAAGVLPSLVPVVVGLALVLLPNWRSRQTLRCLAVAAVASLPWFVFWPALLNARSPELLQLFWDENWREVLKLSFSYMGRELAYFGELLTWFAWPALPLAAWTLWGYRRRLLRERRYQLPIVFLAVVLVLTSVSAETRDIQALPMLLPLTLLAAGGVDTLRRGAANALGWFGNMTFAMIGLFLWFAWAAMIIGLPERFSTHLLQLHPGFVPAFAWLPFVVAVGLTLLWLLPVRRSFKSGRRAVSNWAAGLTLMWGLLATLWLPWLNHGKSYAGVMEDLKRHLPASYTCIASAGLGAPQRALLDYYADVTTRRVEAFQGLECNVFILQFNPEAPDSRPGLGWTTRWEGGRPGEKDERFRLLTFGRPKSHD
jgi:4-amino-4-deoxy-L-arabinose transferase-like glycosyltransferase